MLSVMNFAIAKRHDMSAITLTYHSTSCKLVRKYNHNSKRAVGAHSWQTEHLR